jgi:hypothetical protein
VQVADVGRRSGIVDRRGRKEGLLGRNGALFATEKLKNFLLGAHF